MKKQILQIENTNASEFIPKLVGEIKAFLKEDSQNQKDSEILLTREETAELLSISLPTLWKYTRDGLFPGWRIGSRVRYKKSEILSALKKMNKFEEK
jgi:excisionase family DNA binding protein